MLEDEEENKPIGEERKYELRKAWAVHHEIRLALCEYKELSGFVEAGELTPEDVTYIKTLKPRVTFEEE